MMPQARLQPSAPMSIARRSPRPAAAMLSEPVKVSTIISPNSTSDTRSIGSNRRLRDMEKLTDMALCSSSPTLAINSADISAGLSQDRGLDQALTIAGVEQSERHDWGHGFLCERPGSAREERNPSTRHDCSARATPQRASVRDARR
jgi:hypothetical protein